MALRPTRSYSLAIAATATVGTNVVPLGVYNVRLATTADCYVYIGVPAGGAALTTANGMLLRSSTVGEPFGCAPGDIVSVIAGAAGGTLNVTEMSA